MNNCNYCNYQIYMPPKKLYIFSLTGQKININPYMYCSKECFITKNMFTERFEIFENSSIYKYNTKNIDFRKK